MAKKSKKPGKTSPQKSAPPKAKAAVKPEVVPEARPETPTDEGDNKPEPLWTLNLPQRSMKDDVDQVAWFATDNAVRMAAEKFWEALPADKQNMAAMERAADRLSCQLMQDAPRGVKQALATVIELSRKSVEGSLWVSSYGQHEAGWFSLYDYFRDAVGLVDETQPMMGIMKIAMNAGWWLAHENVCWVSERPSELHLREDGSLHNENGPAMAYPDGFSFWWIDGVQVPEKVVTNPELQTIDEMLKESNADVRAIRIRRFGWPRFIRETQATCLDERENPVEGTREALYDCRQLVGANRLIASCATGRVIDLSVPENITTCQEAQAWLNHGLTSVGRT